MGKRPPSFRLHRLTSPTLAPTNTSKEHARKKLHDNRRISSGSLCHVPRNRGTPIRCASDSHALTWLVVSRQRVLLASLLLAALMLLASYLWITRPEPPIYAQTIDAVVDHPERFLDIKTRASGYFVVGSCTRIAAPCEYRFQIRDGKDRTLNVRARQCGLPETDDLYPEVRLVLEGHMAPDGSYFDASAVLVNSTRKYELPPSPPPPRRSLCPYP